MSLDAAFGAGVAGASCTAGPGGGSATGVSRAGGDGVMGGLAAVLPQAATKSSARAIIVDVRGIVLMVS